MTETKHAAAARVPMVVDPVLVASSGDRLLDEDAVAALTSLLVAHAFIVTPNLPEAAILTGHAGDTPDDMKRAADALMNVGAHAALIKGGHGAGAAVRDLLALQSGFTVFEHPRLDTQNTHGTGCTLASALAAQLALQMAGASGDAAQGAGARGAGSGGAPPVNLETAAAAALDYVHNAIRTAPKNLGTGKNKPLNHAV